MMLGERLAEGRTAEVFAWGETQILKLYREWCPLSWVEHEWRIARIVQEAGLDVPSVSEMIQTGGRGGLIYERVEGPTQLGLMLAKPWMLLGVARQLAALHAQIHQCAVPALPPLREKLETRIRAAEALPASDRDKALAALEKLPDGEALCHGDFHPNNILISPRGPIVIDWTDAARGCPLADVARTSLMIHLAAPSSSAERLLVLFGRRLFHAAYLRRYFQLRPDSRAALSAWMLPVAAARLEDGIPEEQSRLLALIRAAQPGS